MKKLILSLFILSIASVSIAQKIVGYIPQYRTTQWMDQHVEWDKMTDAYYFGARVGNTQGTAITLEETSRFLHVRNRANQHGLDLWLSIGGWGKSENFSQVAASSNARINFANKMVELCETWGLVGVDLDWEFPASTDKANYKLLLKAISDAFDADGNGYLLSVAAGAEQGHANNWDSGSFQYIDHFNIMTYDDPKLTDGNHSSLKFMKEAMDIYHLKGCPYEKMLGGVAFYSRCSAVQMYNQFDNATNFNSDLAGGKCYNGKQTCQDKLEYVYSTKGGLGVLIWEVTQDVKGQYSLLNALHEKADEIGCDIKVEFATPSFSICGKSSVQLKPTVTSESSSVSYQWQKNGNNINNATSKNYTASSQAEYTVIASNNDCSTEAEVVVEGTLGAIDLGENFHLCETSFVDLDAKATGGNILWYKNGTVISGETTSLLKVSEAGTYKVVNSATNCASVESEVTVTSGLVTSDDALNCGDSGVTLSINESTDSEVTWFDSETSENPIYMGDNYFVNPNQTTTYYVAAGVPGGVDCNDAEEWSVSQGYQPKTGAGNEIFVTYQDKLYSLKPSVWWSLGNNPVTFSNMWKEEGDCGGSSCARTSVTIESVSINDSRCVTSIESKFESERYSVYPNPSNNLVTVQHENEIVELTILSISGQVLIQTDQNELNISSLNQGTYILEILTETGKTVTKVIKE